MVLQTDYANPPWTYSATTVFWMHCIPYTVDKFCYLSLNTLTAMRAMLDICEKFAVDP